jgi:hypothetical protein
MVEHDSLLALIPSSLPEAARSIEGLYLRCSGWLAQHLPRIGTLIVAALLSLYARRINDTVRRVAAGWPFPLRVAAFIAVVGFGFGLIIAAASPLVAAGLRSVGTYYLLPATLCAFIVVGILAERSGRI